MPSLVVRRFDHDPNNSNTSGSNCNIEEGKDCHGTLNITDQDDDIGGEHDEDFHEGKVSKDEMSIITTEAHEHCITTIQNVSDASKSWHLEMLLGLFLRCDESELSVLAKESGVDRTALCNDVTQTKVVSAKDNTGNSCNDKTVPKKMKQDITVKPTLFNESILQYPSQLSLLPEILTKFDINGHNFLRKRDRTVKLDNTIDRKRKQYASRNIKEVRSLVLKTFQDRVLRNRITDSETPNEASIPLSSPSRNQVHHNQSDKVKSSDSSTVDKLQNSHDTFALHYNECSLAAVASWACSQTSTSATNHQKKEISPRNGEHTSTRKRKKINSEMFYRPAPSRTFRKCMICFGYGHYELECQQLIKREESIRDRRKLFKTQEKLANETCVQQALSNCVLAKYANSNDFLTDDNLNKLTTPLPTKGRQDVVAEDGPLRRRELEYKSYPWVNMSVEKKMELNPYKIDIKDPPIMCVSSSQRRPSQIEIEDLNKTDTSLASSATFGKDLLRCHGCGSLFHRQCLNTPLEAVPEGEWFCEKCFQYDSDVSSAVELEGLDDFVIEQRKLSLIEVSGARRTCIDIGLSDEGWDTSVCVVGKENLINSPDINNTKNLKESTALESNIENAQTTLANGEICWAQRRFAPQGKPGRDYFWPATFQNRVKVDGSDHSRYTVKPFGLGVHRFSVNEVLPFFPHFEEYGYTRIKYGQNQQWYNYFVKGLNEAVAELGLKSFEQALKTAKEIAMTTRTTSVERSNCIEESYNGSTSRNENDFRRDEKWTNCDTVKVDNFLILARSEFDASTSEKLEPQKIINDITGKLPSKQRAPIDKVTHHNITYFPSIEKLMGSIIAFPLDVAHDISELRTVVPSYVIEEQNSQTQFGVVADLNRLHGKVLVRQINDIDRLISAIGTVGVELPWHKKAHDNHIDVDIKLLSLGISSWIPIKSILFMVNAASLNSEQRCHSVVKSSLSRLRAEFSQKWKKSDVPEKKKIETERLILKDNEDTDKLNPMVISSSQWNVESEDGGLISEEALQTKLERKKKESSTYEEAEAKISVSSAPMLTLSCKLGTNKTASKNIISSETTTTDIESICDDASLLKPANTTKILGSKRNIKSITDSSQSTSSTANAVIVSVPLVKPIFQSATTDTKVASVPVVTSPSKQEFASTNVASAAVFSSPSKTSRIEADFSVSLASSPSTATTETATATTAPTMLSPSRVVGTKVISEHSASSLKKNSKGASLANGSSTSRSRSASKISTDVTSSPITHTTNNGETLFFAEGVLDERISNGCKEYLIKWKGYPEEEATWEPEKKFLYSNFLRTYLAHKIASELRSTPAAEDKDSVTSQTIRIIEKGLQMLMSEPNSLKRKKKLVKKRRCLFCFKLLENNRAFGGHVRLHSKEVNYELIREASRHADDAWYTQLEK